MVRHTSTTTEPTATTTTTTTTATIAGVASANAKIPMHKDKDINGASSLASSAVDAVEPGRSACRPEHAFHAFDALYCALTNATPVKPLFPDDKYPLFVTWNTRVARRSSVGGSGANRASGWSTRLRGCIGTFDAQPLRAGLEEYALLSAFRDHRFRRVQLRELPSLECGISLLTDFEDAASYRDWTIGTHGIQITFTPPPTSPSASDAPSPLSSAVSLLSRPLASFSSHSHSHSHSTIRRTLSATYLPEVAPDQGWEHIDAIDSAIRKAGWNGRISEDLRRAVRVRRYRSRKCVVGWDEFVAWRAERGVPVSVDLLDGRERGLDHLGHGQEGEEEDDDDDDDDEDEDKGGF